MKKFFTTAGLLLLGTAAFAQDAAAAAPTTWTAGKYLYILGLGIAAAACGLAQGKAVSSACEGIARNPQASGNIRTTMIIGLALIEALVIYVLISPFLAR
jgi:F-type H+-transporting ATPase subunit c